MNTIPFTLEAATLHQDITVFDVNDLNYFILAVSIDSLSI